MEVSKASTETSSKTKGGTRGYRSSSYERTRLFAPVDDYVSLYLCAVKTFELDKDKRLSEFLDPLGHLLESSTDVSLVIREIEKLGI